MPTSSSARRASVLAVVVLLGALVASPSRAATPSPAATAFPALQVGVHVHGTWGSYTDAQLVTVLDRMAAAHVQWIRVDLGWASYQEKGPDSYSQWYVDKADRVIDLARSRGIKVLAQPARTPGWANGGQGTNVPPTDLTDWTDFLRWLGTHLRGRVDAYQVWNEPNQTAFFAGTPSQYAGMLRGSYTALKAVDPSTPVVTAGSSYVDTGWWSKVYAAGISGSFDVLAVHPYMGVADAPPETPDDGTMWTLRHVAAMRKLMVDHGDGGRPIWFTEFGWATHPNWDGIANWERGVTEAVQADYLVRTLDLVRDQYPYVTNVFWYNERDNGPAGSTEQDYTRGLLRNDLTAKPSYEALRRYLATSALAVSTPDLVPESDTGRSSTDNVTSATTLTFTGTAPAGSTTRLVVDGVAGEGVAVSDGRYRLSTTVAPGSHQVSASSTLSDGRVVASPGALTVRVDTTKPKGPKPAASLLAGSALGTALGLTVGVSWPSVETTAGYTVQRSNDGGTTWQSVVRASTRSARPRLVADGRSTLIRVRAVDQAGNVGEWTTLPVRVRTLQQGAYGGRFSGSAWRYSPQSTASAGSLRWAWLTGHSASRTVSAQQVAWVAHVGPSRGRAAVLVDGDVRRTVDLWASSLHVRRVHGVTSLAAGTSHAVTLRVLDTRRAASTGTRVDVDAFLLLDRG